MNPPQGVKRKRPLQAIGIVAAGLLLAVLATLYSAGASGSLGWSLPDRPVEAEQVRSASAQDIGRLWHWSDGELQGGAANGSWELKWIVKGLTESDAGGLAERLGILQADLKPAENESGGHSGILWQAEHEMAGGKMIAAAVKVNGDAADQVLTILRFYPAGHVQRSLLESMDVKIRELVRDTGTAAEPLLSLRLSGQKLRADSVQRIEQAAGASSLDEYRDEAVRIRTYASNGVDASIRLDRGDRESEASLQIAERLPQTAAKQPSDTAVTIGIPLISGEALDAQHEGT